MSEHASSVTEEFSSCKKAAVSLVSVVLLTESAQLGRDRKSYVGVSSPGKDPSEVRKSSNSALNAAIDDGNAVLDSVDARGFGRTS